MTAALNCVCFLTGTLSAFAGAERMTAVIAGALAARGYRVLVLSLWDAASVFPLHPDVRHHALFPQRPSFKSKYLATVRGIRRFVREHGVDVLVEVDTMLTLFTVPATAGMNVRRIAWEHCHFDQDLGKRARRVARWLAARTDEAVVVLTERDREAWLKHGARQAKVHAIGNALPFAMPAAPPDRPAAVRPTMLAVGRLTRAKGFDTLLHAWQIAHVSMPQWQLRIVGNGEERARLDSLREALALTHCVTLTDATADIEAEYRHVDAFCLSSRYEGFGLVLIEAMAYGLPVIATDCETGPRTFLKNGENALVVPVDDAPVLAAAIMKLAADSQMRNALAKAGRQTARQFAPSEIADRWVALLDTMSTGPLPKDR